MRLTPKNQRKILDPAVRSGTLIRQVTVADLTRLPKLVQDSAATADPTALKNAVWEVAWGAHAATLAYDAGGLTITTGANQYDTATLMPLLPLAANGVVTEFISAGHVTTRSSCTIGNVYKTGASGDQDSGRSIGFSTTIRTDTSAITSTEYSIGMSGTVDIPFAISGGDTAGTHRPYGASGPADAFFYYFHPSISANWLLAVNNGTLDVFVDSGVPVAANSMYLLECVLDNNRYPTFTINKTSFRHTSQVDAATLFMPAASVKVNVGSSATRSLTIRDLRCMRSVGYTVLNGGSWSYPSGTPTTS